MREILIDGSGSPFCECIDLPNAFIPEREKLHKDVAHLYFEKDSYYTYADNRVTTLYKDFSALGYFYKSLSGNPTLNLDNRVDFLIDFKLLHYKYISKEYLYKKT